MSSKKSKSVGVEFDYLGDQKVKKGKEKFLDETKKWTGPSHSERREEKKEVARKVKKSHERPEKVSWKKRAGGLAAILFIGGVGLFNFISTIGSFAAGNGITDLDYKDTAKLKSVLFGGDPWLIYCVNNETENHRLPKVLEESRAVASSLGLNIGVLRCWDQTESGRSVAQKFKMNLKPPLAFVVANGDKPRVLNLVGINKPEVLQKRVTPALKLETHRIDALKKWPTHCTSRRACVVIGHKNTAQRDNALNIFKPILERHRATKIVTLDTSFWQLKLDDAVLATRRKDKEKRAEVLCIARAESTPDSNATHRGAFLQDLDSSSAAAFVANCNKQTELVALKTKPSIKARSSKPKVVTPPRPRPRPSPRPTPKPATKPMNKKADHVGSRASLEAEEPLFEAVDEEESEDGESSDEEADEEESEERDSDDDSVEEEEDSSDEVEL